MWSNDEEFWTADCRCGNYEEDKLVALANERHKAVAALDEVLKWKHAYQNEIERIEGNKCECDTPHEEVEHG